MKRTKKKTGRRKSTGKPRKTAKRKAISTVTRSRKKGKPSRKKKPARLEKRLDAFKTSVDILTTKALVNGKHLIGATNWLTPTGQGLSKISKILRPISVKRLGDFSIYSFDLHITFNDRSGNPVNVTLSNVGVPRLSEKDERFYGRNKQNVFNRKIRRLITRKIFQAFAERFPYPNKVINKKVSEREAQKIIKGIKVKRNTKIQFVLYREIHAADKGQHLSGKRRHRR